NVAMLGSYATRGSREWFPATGGARKDSRTSESDCESKVSASAYESPRSTNITTAPGAGHEQSRAHRRYAEVYAVFARRDAGHQLECDCRSFWGKRLRRRRAASPQSAQR